MKNSKASQLGYKTASVTLYVSLVCGFILMFCMEHTDGSFNWTALWWHLICVAVFFWSEWRTQGGLL